ncbi:MAG TPA: hypothetical protein GX510_06845 [Firmicutes bacterium]|nr:hypothetical protein [Candidatus Fermentithermobacillaceae bacterium]
MKLRALRVTLIGFVTLSLLANAYLLFTYRQMALDRGNMLARLADYIPVYLGYAESTIQSAVAGNIKDYVLLSQADPYLRAAADSIRHLKYLDPERWQAWEDMATALDETRYAMSFDRLGVTPEWDSIPPEAAQKLEAIRQLLADLQMAFPGKISYGQHPEVAFDSERVEAARASALDYLQRTAR